MQIWGGLISAVALGVATFVYVDFDEDTPWVVKAQAASIVGGPLLVVGVLLLIGSAIVSAVNSAADSGAARVVPPPSND